MKQDCIICVESKSLSIENKIRLFTLNLIIS